MVAPHYARANGYDNGKQRYKTIQEQIESSLDPDADEQRSYRCYSCNQQCINPVGSLPESADLCVACSVRDLGPNLPLEVWL